MIAVTKITVVEMLGLCHKCLTSQVEVRQYDEGILCQSCYGKFFNKKSPENQPPPTFQDLKRKFERR